MTPIILVVYYLKTITYKADAWLCSAVLEHIKLDDIDLFLKGMKNHCKKTIVKIIVKLSKQINVNNLCKQNMCKQSL